MMRAAYAATALACTILINVPSICAADKVFFVSARDGAKAIEIYSIGIEGKDIALSTDE